MITTVIYGVIIWYITGLIFVGLWWYLDKEPFKLWKYLGVSIIGLFAAAPIIVAWAMGDYSKNK